MILEIEYLKSLTRMEGAKGTSLTTGWCPLMTPPPGKWGGAPEILTPAVN